MQTLVRSGAVDIIVVDSVAALVPAAEIEGDMAIIMWASVSAANVSSSSQTDWNHFKIKTCCLIFINQLRMKIGVMFGNPETTTGGNALKFTISKNLHPQDCGY